MSLPATHRAVAALLGATAVWRALSGVAALVRWLWLGELVGNGSMALLLISVVVGPIVGAGAGDAALRRGIWSPSRRAHRRRLAAVAALLVLPFLATASASWLLGNGPASLPLYGVVTLSVTAIVVLTLAGSGRHE
ncbi:hypothetical protein B4589_008660 [Halolamina sp. CBA1230]|uniref:hypothetical protein n=1 Tax=Halolamina sp. CBA1230 TaxID=1853690 RepID=UPI0009A18D6B|nr:hypothetical protein [Halolamina sp. CBA1230]QKY20447.1 hypothetical protein B4589_008660 [Halolamina sp. CBA1230]